MKGYKKVKVKESFKSKKLKGKGALKSLNKMLI